MLYDESGIFTWAESDWIEDCLKHYGTPRHSGRYPWGSGDNPYQRNCTFLSKVNELKKAKDENGNKLFTEKQIAEAMNMNTSELRKQISMANAENYQYLVSEARRLKTKGMSNVAIAERMGTNESTIRGYLNANLENSRLSLPAKNAEILKKRLDEVDYVQVGAGTEYYLNNASQTSLINTLHRLESQGYSVHNIQVEQQGMPGQYTTVKVLAKPGVETKEIYRNRDKIAMPVDIYQDSDTGELRKVEDYVSVNPKRVGIRYAEEGGKDRDGVIELRRGVEDLDMGKNHYAQVRIKIGEDRYAKGMAVYSDDLPDGVDILINSNKKKGTSMADALKPTKEDLENPFGANIKEEHELTRCQRHYIGKDGKEHLSAINIVKEEGDVDQWSRTLASQFLSKQAPELARQQLKMHHDIAKAEFDELMGYTNPTVKAKMLEDFAGKCETDAVHLQGAALPRQATKFILPLTNIGENEVYAPGYRDGEEVALVRFPHASISEIPILRVNNKNKLADSMISKDALDAIGINPKAAEKLSGADFDGDTVLIIPTNNVKIRSSKQFPELEGFDPKTEYPKYDGMHVMTAQEKGKEMGRITNLITDMTIQGANQHEIALAIRHSMVVIDAEKHELDYKRSEQENKIPELRAKYQPEGGSSTLLSRSTGPERIAERKEKRLSSMTPEEKERYYNGEMIYEETGRSYSKTEFPKSRMSKEERTKWNDAEKILKDKNSSPVDIERAKADQKDVKAAMYATDRVRRVEKGAVMEVRKGQVYDPYSLTLTRSKETTKGIEKIYAEHAISMHELARLARKEARSLVDNSYNAEANKKYAAEVASLDAKLAIAKRNAPLEKQAQILAGVEMDAILKEHPDLWNDKEHLSRERGRQLMRAREKVGAKKLLIGDNDNPLTDREWEAIQAGAVSKTKLKSIMANTDTRRIRELATPKTKTGIPPAKLSRAKRMQANGYSQAEIADMLDISLGALKKALYE